MEKIYNKLVRDKIPEIIKNNNGKPIARILNNTEYKQELEKKLLEEYHEVLNTKNTEERIEELADMLEIISALSNLENKKLEDVINVSNIKRDKRGGFEKQIFLEKVIESDNK